ncbi:MAG: tRNA uridine-5-carboxymethylaminomethyl(34) synthesis GTPase MnmE [Clostridia bacterium]|nr:tRNA uridine-5-carboxymethylaminomethyl(34) synthesis GTPase MnmE [Clostridia bacterium]
MKTERNDTVAAVATARGTGGVAIIRISGENALSIAKKVFRFSNEKAEIKPRYVYFGNIISNGTVTDSGLFTYFKAPASYTGEDVVEISCHGGVLVTDTVLSAVLSAGARLATAGEFTKRAFINGKLLLDEAESVGDIIEADSERALVAAAANLLSGTGKSLLAEKEILKEVLARFFAVIDWPDEDIEEDGKGELLSKLYRVSKRFSSLISTAKNGIAVKNGIKTVIAGCANAGKSTLMNALANCERSIVTSVAGTTRDVISEAVTVGGVKLILSDTAGIRESDDVVEKIGIERAVKEIEAAELIIFTVDISKPFSSEERSLADFISRQKKPTVTVFTKSDLAPLADVEAAARELSPENAPFLSVSAKNGEGIARLSEIIAELSGLDKIKKNEPLILSQRQYGCLSEAKARLEAAIVLIEQDQPADMVAFELEGVIDSLSSLDGTKTNEEILATVFSKFCVGK